MRTTSLFVNNRGSKSLSDPMIAPVLFKVLYIPPQLFCRCGLCCHSQEGFHKHRSVQLGAIFGITDGPEPISNVTLWVSKLGSDEIDIFLFSRFLAIELVHEAGELRHEVDHLISRTAFRRCMRCYQPGSPRGGNRADLRFGLVVNLGKHFSPVPTMWR